MDVESVERLDSYDTDEDQQGTLKNVHLIIKDYLTCNLSQKQREGKYMYFSLAT